MNDKYITSIIIRTVEFILQFVVTLAGYAFILIYCIDYFNLEQAVSTQNPSQALFSLLGAILLIIASGSTVACIVSLLRDYKNFFNQFDKEK